MPRPASSVIAPPAARMLAATLVFVTSASLAQSASPSPETLERGRYMVVTGQCNNCHTAGYSASKGTVVESQWLFGDRKGRREPEGTVYATNLRHFVSTLSLEQWLLVARRGQPRAPMPWWNLRATSDTDLAAMYFYLRSLQPVGEPVPDFEPAPR